MSLSPQPGEHTNGLLRKILQSLSVASAVTWEAITGKPSTFPPEAHTHTPAEAGADPAGTAASALAAHTAAADPHPNYQLRTERGQANGYAPLGPDNLVPAAHLPPASGGVDYQSRFVAGAFTWTNPSPTVRRLVRGRLVTGGGGGGSGRKGAAGTIRCGGGGGAPGGQLIFEAWSDELPAVVNATVGAGGAGGASVAGNDTNGNAGVAGGATVFLTNRYQASPGGASGGGGTNSGGAAGAGTTGVLLLYATSSSPAGGAASATGGAGSNGANPFSLFLVPSGGAGGGISNTDVAGNGGNGGRNAYGSLGESIGAISFGGLAPGGNGSTSLAAGRGGVGGFGGGGGAGHPAGNGGAGSFGVSGGGGGGGGAATNNLGNSGAGGTGGDGSIEIWTFL